MLYIGIDLGTSSVKLLLMDAAGNVKNIVSREYPLYFPNPGWSEQKPEDWYKETMQGLKELLEGFPKEEVAGISFGGQMHGLVILDDKDEVIRPAILWNDGRTTEECDYLNNEIGKETLSEYTANIAFAGFTAPKILWMQKNEPENFKKVVKIMLPKDYLAYKLTGEHCTDVSDASGMLLLDVKNRCWSKEMCEICGITTDMLPKLYESYECVGTVLPEIAKELGLSENVKVAAGAGDNAAAAVATGTVGDGKCNISLGTSGTIFISSAKFGVDKHNALHAFCDANGAYHLMGCMLSAASCNKKGVASGAAPSIYRKETHMEKLTLQNPITINGKKVKTLTYDTDAITVGMFADADARKLRATSNKGGGSAGACELDYSLHAYLAMMAIVAVNSDIDVSDLERISGPDVMELMRIGRNFTTARSAAQSEESGSESSSETTLEPSTPQSASSDGNA